MSSLLRRLSAVLVEKNPPPGQLDLRAEARLEQLLGLVDAPLFRYPEEHLLIFALEQLVRCSPTDDFDQASAVH